jgi:hypothetical protein
MGVGDFDFFRAIFRKTYQKAGRSVIMKQSRWERQGIFVHRNRKPEGLVAFLLESSGRAVLVRQSLPSLGFSLFLFDVPGTPPSQSTATRLLSKRVGGIANHPSPLMKERER